MQMEQYRQRMTRLKVTYHHANICLVLLVHSIVQHDVHELIKATQHASDMSVGVQGHYR